VTEGGRVQNSERLCVVILNWNTSAHVERCVEGLVGSSYVDLVIVDNHSCDADYERLMAVAEQCGAHVIRTHENLGYAGGMNTGMRTAHHAGYWHALLLNGDTRPDGAVVHELWKNRDRAALLGVAQTSDMAGPLEEAPLYGTVGVLSGGKLHETECSGEGTGFHYVDVVSGAGLLVNLEAARDVGWMDERYFHYVEEVDFCVRLRRAGYAVGHSCRIPLRHLQGGSLALISPQARYYKVRNELMFARRLFGWPQLLRIPRAYLEIAWVVVKGPWKKEAAAAAWGLIDGLRLRGGPLAHRRLLSR
jgi:GT2 family glycosyltransferase